jgi:hypothetical protein
MSSTAASSSRCEPEYFVIRLLQLLFLAIFIWFFGWTPVYEVVVLNKTVLNSIYDNFGSFLAWFVSLLAIPYLQILFVFRSRVTPRKRTWLGTQSRINRAIAYGLLILGLAFLPASALFSSHVQALVGLGLTFWGALLLYIAQPEHVPLELLDAVASSTLVNVEKVLASFGSEGKGVYLPPKYLKDLESGLVFIPSRTESRLPQPEEINEEKLYVENPTGIFLSPPGLALSKFFEKKLGTTFTKTDLNYIKDEFPKLFIEDIEIAQDVDVKTEGNMVTFAITNHVFRDICEKTRKLQRTHESIGCVLTSAIACALAKATGKLVTIEKEEQSQDGKVTRIQYRMVEG